MGLPPRSELARDAFEINYPFPSSSPELDPQEITYEIMRWPDFDVMSSVLIKKIKKIAANYDLVVSPKRGGVFPGQIVADGLGLEMVTYWPTHFNSKILAGNEAAGMPIELKEGIADPEKIRGRKVLWVDDVNHNSTTLIHGWDYLMNLGADSVRTAVLDEKPRFQKVSADFVVRFTNSWKVYPWENLIESGPFHDPHEFFRERLPEWMISDDGEYVTWEQVMERSLAIGFPPEELPTLSDQSFLGYLGTNLNERHLEVLGKNISGIDGWHELFPGIDLSPFPEFIHENPPA